MEPDYNKLKKRSAYPFETVAVAIAFSPRLEAFLMETKRMVSMFGSQLVIIHVGKKDTHHEEVLDK
jgi:hypothetical protein